MSKRIPIALAALSILTSCASGTTPSVVQPKAAIYIAEPLKEECSPLPVLPDGKQSSLLVNHVETARLYHLCKQRHSNLVHAIEEQRGVAP